MRRLPVILLFALTLIVYALSTYGSIRSPDAEIMFRSGETLAARGDFAVPRPLEGWPGFGVEKGRDGKLYPVFGPLQSVFIAGAIHLGHWTRVTNLLAHLGPPPGHYHGANLRAFQENKPPADLPGAARRSAAALLNIFAALACVWIFRLTVLRLLRDARTAHVMTLLFAFATALWPYAGTLFSEVPALFFAMASFYILIPAQHKSAKDDGSRGKYMLSGAALGCAVLAHVSALFFAPFFLFAAFAPNVFREDAGHKIALPPDPRFRAGAGAALFWSLGLLCMLALYAWYNMERFGNPLETGRTLALPGSPHHGHWTDPRAGLFGLLFSGGKGLFLFNPILIIALLYWGRMHRRLRALSLLIICMAAARLLMISMRSEWHGGFCLGPRHLFLLLPFLLLPAGFALRDFLNPAQTEPRPRAIRRRFAALAGAALLFAHQAYLAFGEIFSFYHHQRTLAHGRKLNIFADHALYLDWKYSPLLHSHELKRGPWSLQFTEGNDAALFMIIACASLLLCAVAWYLHRGSIAHNTKPPA